MSAVAVIVLNSLPSLGAALVPAYIQYVVVHKSFGSPRLSVSVVQLHELRDARRVDVLVCARVRADAEDSPELHIINAVGTESVATFLNVPWTVSVL